MQELQESIEKINETFRLAISLMGKHGVPPTPNNYKVWYEYASGNPRLGEVINGMVESGHPINQQVNDRLYTDYVEYNHMPMYQKLEEGIGRILMDMTEGIETTGNEVATRGKKIETISNQVAPATDSGKIRSLASSILFEAKAIVESGEKFKHRLENTSEEVAALKKELASEKAKAITDPLTGLANRRALEIELKKKIKQAMEKNHHLTLLMADIDHFKKINDTHGHLVGDRVLAITATMLKDQVKGKDFIARYGGEEFILLLPDTPLIGAMIVAEKIRSNLESLQLQVNKNQLKQAIGKITISIGVARYVSGESMEAFVARADRCLYHSKNNGRNQVTSENMI